MSGTANVKIALAGNPNSGKTTLFNALTGSNQYVGNWPGVTVEKKDGRLAGAEDVVIQDLPGIYSLSPYSLEERVSRKFLVEENPNAILNIVDGTNIERNLYLSTQLAELGLPMVMAVNMMDVVKKNGDRIDFAKIAKALRCEVVGISALKDEGGLEAAQKAVEMAKKTVVEKGPRKMPEVPHVFSGSVEHAIAHIEESIQGKVPARSIRWYAIKIFERDRDVIRDLGIGVGEMKHLEEHIRDCEKELEDDAESIITYQRYEFIKGLVGRALSRSEKRRNKASLSDKIDRVVTSRWLALPVFVTAICVVGWLAVVPGGAVTEWANEHFLGEAGWNIGALRVPGVTALVAKGLAAVGANETVTSIVKDGAWAGVSTVLGFVPVIVLVFLFLAFLEECGYMARVAFIMDRVFRKFGLSGKSFIPMIVGIGCGVPAVMAARSIEKKRDQRMTIILATFLPCGAKLAIITMFSVVFFREQWWMFPLMYFVGIAIIVLGGIALKKTRAFAGEAAPFVMELPPYHLPAPSRVWRHTWVRAKGFVLKAGLVIFPACLVLWFITHFDFGFNLLGDKQIDRSILASVGGYLAYLLKPLGFGTWQGAAAAVSAEIAKEQATATLRVVSSSLEGASSDLRVANLFAAMSDFPKLAALSFMVFNLFMPPCIVAIAVSFMEMGSKAWGWFAVGFQLFVGYVLALSVYQLGVFFAGGGFGFWTAVAIVVDLWCLWMIFRPARSDGQ